MKNNFKTNFKWGAAAASYQIEGAYTTDGRGLSVWDQMTEWDGKVARGHTGRTACDHYHHMEHDCDLMKEMGLQAYRFSVSWPRVLPDGIGSINTKGLDFYDRLVDKLCENNIEPWLTLFHWDYPIALYHRGGWLHPDSSDWFAEYTRVLVDKFSDRVTSWFTFNEPQCFVGLGHYDGEHAPGLKLPFSQILQITHNVLLAHGKAAQAIRNFAHKKPAIGAAPVGIISYPRNNTPEDIELARERTFAVRKRDVWNNSWFADPMVLGHYPEDGLALFHKELPKITGNDLETICQPLDFYGANIYHGTPVGYGENGSIIEGDFTPGSPLTSMEWNVTPEALYWGPRFLYEKYKLPIVISENGLANNDWVHCDGKVHDPQRIDFTKRYLRELNRVIGDGVEVSSYFHWSVMDNFEWTFGYTRRFGLIHVDYQTQKRTPKDSAFWYKDVIRTNGLTLQSSEFY